MSEVKREKELKLLIKKTHKLKPWGGVGRQELKPDLSIFFCLATTTGGCILS